MRLTHTAFLAVAGLAIGLIGGCSHPMVITPSFDNLSRSAIQPIDKAVGYYIDPALQQQEVKAPGPTGDSAVYHPYRDLEPALQKVLYNQFRTVKRLSSPADAAEIRANHIALVFEPQISTEAFFDNVLIWPPTRFTVTLECQALDETGKSIWRSRISATGEAEFSDIRQDFSIAAKRASEKVFQQLQASINTAPEFRN